MNNQEKVDGVPAHISAWIKVTARADGGIEVDTPNCDMNHPQNIAAMIELLSVGISALCHTRLKNLAKNGPPKIVPAGMEDLVKISRKAGL